MSKFWLAFCILFVVAAASRDEEEAEELERKLIKIYEECDKDSDSEEKKARPDAKQPCFYLCMQKALKFADEDGNCINYENTPYAEKVGPCCDELKSKELDACAKAVEVQKCYENLTKDEIIYPEN